MTSKKQIKPGDKVGLKLTPAERVLLLNVVNGLTEKIREVVRATPTAQPVMLTRDDLGDLEGQIAAAAKHTKGQKLRPRFDAISQQIQRLLALHDDEPGVTANPATSGFINQSVELLAGPTLLVNPLPTESLVGENHRGVKLTDKQRESLLRCTELFSVHEVNRDLASTID